MNEPISNKKYRKLYISTAIQKTLEVFYKFPEKEFSMSDLAKEAGVAKANLGKILSELEKIGFIQVEKLSKIWRIKANQSNWYYIRGKIVHNLNFIYESGLVEYIVKKYNNPKSVVLFGSFRKGEDMSKSDIDIAVELPEIKDYSAKHLAELGEYEESIGRKVQIHEFNRKVVDINVFNNIANGIVLYGFLEVKK